MTTTEKTFVEATRNSQYAFLQLWTDGVHKFFGLLPGPDAKVPSVDGVKARGVPSEEEMVDHAFDYAETLLAVQRACAKSALAASRSIASSTAWMAQSTDKAAAPNKS